jgi:hypothetical protein
MDDNPIRQLQNFLGERGKVLEQITSIRSALATVRGDPPSALASHSAAISSADITRTPVDACYQRLLLALQEMQAQIEQRMRPALQLVIQNQVDQLRRQADEKFAALRDCVSQIDRNVLQCLAGLDEYQKRYADLDMLNKNLTGLGVLPEPLPENISAENLSETISARMNDLGSN